MTDEKPTSGSNPTLSSQLLQIIQGSAAKDESQAQRLENLAIEIRTLTDKVERHTTMMEARQDYTERIKKDRADYWVRVVDFLKTCIQQQGLTVLLIVLAAVWARSCGIVVDVGGVSNDTHTETTDDEGSETDD